MNVAGSKRKFKTQHPKDRIILLIWQPNLLNKNHRQYNQKKKSSRQNPFPIRVSFQIQAWPEYLVCQTDKNNKKTNPWGMVTY